MALLDRCAPASKALMFLAGVVLFSFGFFSGLMHTTGSINPTKNLRAGGQPQEEPGHNNVNFAALRSSNKHGGDDGFVWPGKFAYNSFRALDEYDSEFSVDFSESFAFSYEYEGDVWG